MNFRYFILIILFLLSLNLLSINTVSQTDSVIITKLDGFQFITPALTENNTYVYNNFEFRLYSKVENVTYEIEIDNIMIANGTIRNFRKIIYWKSNKEYITKINIRVDEDYYNYSNIRIFYTGFTNGTIIEEDKVIFTKEEFENYISELKLRLFSSDGLGWFVGIILAHIYVREIKKSVIVEV